MQESRLQQIFAYAAIMFLPWCTWRPLEYSFTWGDVLLIIAVGLNINRMGSIRDWQVPLLIALPLVLVTQALDPEASMVEIGQALYIFGFVLPFGWVAFVGMRPRYLATALLLSLSISSAAAVGQTLGIIGMLGKQRIWEVMGTSRSAGFSLSCSALCLSLSPVFPLLLYVPRAVYRMGFFVAIWMGLLATLAKSVIFAIPVTLYYAAREPNRRGMTILSVIVVVGLMGVFAKSRHLQEKMTNASATVERRAEFAEFSMWERTSTIRFALSYVPQCYVTGIGYAGSHKELMQHLGNTVHVFHVGLILVCGLPAALLILTSLGMLILRSWQVGQHPTTLLLLGQMLSLCTMTVLMHSFEYVVFAVAGAILRYQTELDANRRSQMAASIQHLPRYGGSGLPGRPAGVIR